MNTAEFFSLNDFAVPARLAGGRVINVIFDAQYVDALGVESVSPAATCDSEDVRGLQHNDQIEIEQTMYRITGVQPDGTGVTVLRLMRA